MNFKKDNIYDRIEVIPRDKIKELSNLIKGDLINVEKGINNHCFGVDLKDLKRISFLYFNSENTLKGYCLNLIFKESDFYINLLYYCYVLSLEFIKIDVLALYDTYLKVYRTSLEGRNITTITNRDLKSLGQDFELLLIDNYEIIESINEIGLYRKLLNYEFNETLIKGKKVYLMYSESRREFKIGRSKNPLSRKKQGSTWSPDIEILKIWKGHSILENALKSKFQSKNIGGEFYKLSFDDILNFNQTVIELREEN